jgi:hypothetical protein
MRKENTFSDDVKLNGRATDIIALLGGNYKDFHRNMFSIFGEGGSFCARQITSNNTDKLYNKHTVYHPNTGKPREVFAPRPELKLLQEALNNVLLKTFSQNDNSHGFRNGRSTRTAAETFKAAGISSCTNIDLEKAFDTVKGKDIRRKLRSVKEKLKLNYWQIYIITRILTRNDTLATGSPTSPTVLNWILTPLDSEIEKVAQARGWKYARYADDLSIGHDGSRANEVIRIIFGLIAKAGFRVNRKKLRTESLEKNGCFYVLGIVVRNEKLELPGKVRNRLRGMIRTILGESKTHWNAWEARDQIRRIYQRGLSNKLTNATLGNLSYVIHVKSCRFSFSPF